MTKLKDDFGDYEVFEEDGIKFGIRKMRGKWFIYHEYMNECESCSNDISEFLIELREKHEVENDNSSN